MVFETMPMAVYKSTFPHFISIQSMLVGSIMTLCHYMIDALSLSAPSTCFSLTLIPVQTLTQTLMQNPRYFPAFVCAMSDVQMHFITIVDA